MRRLNGHLVKFALISVGLVGCGFSPGPAGQGVTTGSAASSGNTSGAGGGGGTLVITGVGLNGGGGDVTGGGGTTTCGVTNNPVMPSPPDVLIVQDKSGSMDNDDNDMGCNGNRTGGCGANSKWSQLTTALSSVITATDSVVNWGLKYFSDDSNCDASKAPVVPVAPNSGAAVVRSIQMNSPGGYTPTRDGITYGAQYLGTLTDTNPKFLLLATDGLPNCPSGCAANPGGNMCTMTDNPSEDMAAEMAVTMAASMGYQTFVIGIGNVAAAQNTLNQLAIAGGQPQTGGTTSYYAATDEASLEAALTAIVGKVASCLIALPAAAIGQTNVAVSVNDASGKATKVPEDNNNGWSYTNNGAAIQLNGSYCDNVKGGTYTNVQFLYSCNGQPICIDKLANGQCGD
jgi:hypothetical protein